MSADLIAAVQFGTVFVLAAIFWGGDLVEHLKAVRAAPKARRLSPRPATSRVPAAWSQAR